MVFLKGELSRSNWNLIKKIELSRLNLIVFVEKWSFAVVVELAQLDVETVKRCSEGLQAIPYTPQKRRICAQIELSQSRAGEGRENNQICPPFLCVCVCMSVFMCVCV